jgi:hypothetical protein
MTTSTTTNRVPSTTQPPTVGDLCRARLADLVEVAAALDQFLDSPLAPKLPPEPLCKASVLLDRTVTELGVHLADLQQGLRE